MNAILDTKTKTWAKTWIKWMKDSGKVDEYISPIDAKCSSNNLDRIMDESISGLRKNIWTRYWCGMSFATDYLLMVENNIWHKLRHYDVASDTTSAVTLPRYKANTTHCFIFWKEIQYIRHESCVSERKQRTIMVNLSRWMKWARQKTHQRSNHKVEKK